LVIYATSTLYLFGSIWYLIVKFVIQRSGSFTYSFYYYIVFTFPHGTFSLSLHTSIFITCRYKFFQTKFFWFNLTFFILNFRSQLLIFSFLVYFPLFTKMFQFNKFFLSILMSLFTTLSFHSKVSWLGEAIQLTGVYMYLTIIPFFHFCVWLL